MWILHLGLFTSYTTSGGRQGKGPLSSSREGVMILGCTGVFPSGLSEPPEQGDITEQNLQVVHCYTHCSAPCYQHPGVSAEFLNPREVPNASTEPGAEKAKIKQDLGSTGRTDSRFWPLVFSCRILSSTQNRKQKGIGCLRISHPDLICTPKRSEQHL